MVVGFHLVIIMVLGFEKNAFVSLKYFHILTYLLKRNMLENSPVMRWFGSPFVYNFTLCCDFFMLGIAHSSQTMEEFTITSGKINYLIIIKSSPHCLY